MKKLFLFLFMLHAGWASASRPPLLILPSPATLRSIPSGPAGRWQQHADSLFQSLDRSPVGTGLLANYGLALKDCTPFQGAALTSANLLRHLGEWRLLYAALQTSVYNANATLPPLPAANLAIQQVQQAAAPNVVPIATLLARYDRFTDDAGTAGLITVSNGQLHDAPNRPRLPYEQRTLVALCPLVQKVTTLNPQFSFSSQLRFTNAAPGLTALEFDAGEGQGYRAVAWDQPLSVSYATNGTYTLRFRLTCATGAVLLSQARFEVNQPPAARYNADNAFGTNAVTRPTSALFTDTRAYSSPNGFYAATGRVTVALSDNNTTGVIRRPLIVIEGYDPSAVLRANGVNDVTDYSYNSFVDGTRFGAISTEYFPSNSGDRTIFNQQLSEVGNYDLIFLNFDNGTDYIQRNAYLVERLIQWVNDNKATPQGQTTKEKNVVLGMSMGGLVARYALRDMELRQASTGLAHDTRLYLSHEAPHQGANVPLGVQQMVSTLANTRLVASLTLGDVVVQLGAFAKLLNEPATQQLLLYQAPGGGTAVHQAWLADYNGKGYPTQCRNVATSDGSECGRPQAFGPGAVLLNIQGNGLLNEPYNGYANSAALGLGIGAGIVFLGGIDLITAVAVGAAVATGNFEATADFVVNALPSQQQQRVYHGKVSVTKEILFGLFTTRVVIYANDLFVDASTLAYDSAPGGIYDLEQVAPGFTTLIGTSLPQPVTIFVQSSFDFVPTSSALDIGGGSVALRPQDLTNSYSSSSPPPAPFNTPFANFITAGRENLTHILWDGLNSKWAFQEMQQAPQTFDCQAFCQLAAAISASPISDVCTNTQFSIANLPTDATVQWEATPQGLLTNSSFSGPVFTATASGAGNGPVQLLATVSSKCGQFNIQRRVYVGAPDPVMVESVPTQGCSNGMAFFHIANYDRALTYIITNRHYAAGGAVNGPDFWVKATGVPGGSFTLTVRNNCGFESVDVDAEYPPCEGPTPTYSLAPNPATDEVLVQPDTAPASPSARAAAASPAAPTGIATVRVFDSYGRLRLEQAGHGAASLRLQVGALPAGLYVVHVLHGRNQVSRQQLQIAR